MTSISQTLTSLFLSKRCFAPIQTKCFHTKMQHTWFYSLTNIHLVCKAEHVCNTIPKAALRHYLAGIKSIPDYFKYCPLGSNTLNYLTFIIRLQVLCLISSDYTEVDLYRDALQSTYCISRCLSVLCNANIVYVFL